MIRTKKTTTASTLLSWIVHSVRSQPPCHEDTQAVLWKDQPGKKLRPPTKGQYTCQSDEWTTAEMYPSLVPAKSLRTIVQPSSYLQPHETLCQNHPAKSLPDCWLTETIRCHSYLLLFKPQNFPITCYAAVGNWYRRWLWCWWLWWWSELPFPGKRKDKIRHRILPLKMW